MTEIPAIYHQHWDYKKAIVGEDLDLDPCKISYDTLLYDKNCIYKSHSYDDLEVKPIVLEFFDKPIGKKIGLLFYHKEKPVYLAVDATFYSSDGEYRAPVVNFGNYLLIVEYHEETLNAMSDVLIKNHTIKFSSYPKEVDPMYALCLYYIRNMMSSGKDNKVIDTLDIINKKLFMDTKEYGDIFMSLIYGVPKSSVDRMQAVTHRFEQPVNYFGNKIIPLTVNSVNNFNSLNNKIWLELYIGIVTTNMKLNGISTSFPLLFGKSYINNEKYKLVYDLESTYLKFKNSKIAEQIERELYQTSSHTKIEDVYISYDFENLDVGIHKVIKASQQKLHLSKYSLALQMSHLGITLNENIERGYDNRAVGVGDIFHLIYSLYCLNLQGIIHGDLHLNNVTRCMHKYSDESGKVPLTAYAVPDGSAKRDFSFKVDESDLYEGVDHVVKAQVAKKHLVYYVPGTSVKFLGIIDFSRSIMKYKFEDEQEQALFDSSQREKVTFLYKELFPEFYKKNKPFIIQMASDFEGSFNRLTAFDMYRFSSLYINKMSDKVKDAKAEAVLKVLNAVLLTCEDCLLSPGGIKTGDSINEALMRLFFRQYLKIEAEPGTYTIDNVLVSDAPMYYGISSYNKLPPIYKLTKPREGEKPGTVCATLGYLDLYNSEFSRSLERSVGYTFDIFDTEELKERLNKT